MLMERSCCLARLVHFPLPPRVEDARGVGSAQGARQARTSISIAETTLTFFTETVNEAQKQLTATRPPDAEVFASMNTLTTDRALRNLVGITEEHRLNERYFAENPRSPAWLF